MLVHIIVVLLLHAWQILGVVAGFIAVGWFLGRISSTRQRQQALTHPHRGASYEEQHRGTKRTMVITVCHRCMELIEVEPRNEYRLNDCGWGVRSGVWLCPTCIDQIDALVREIL